MDDTPKILVALALAGHSKGIFDYAAKLAVNLNARLVVVTIINKRDVDAISRVSAMGYEVDGSHYVQGVREQREEILAGLINDAKFPEEKIKTIIQVGNPIDEILKIVASEKVDMVVMGPKGRTDLQHILVGSVAEKIFRRCPVTVVSYRDPTIQRPHCR